MDSILEDLGVTKSTYDYTLLNPPGRDVSDDKDCGKQRKFSKCKNVCKSRMLTTTPNAGTIMQVPWKMEMFHSTSQILANVICLQ